MKILLINKFHYIKGGADRHYLELGENLAKQGHTINYFSMQDVHNQYSEDEKYFVDNMDIAEVKTKKNIGKTVLRMFYNKQAQRNLQRMIDQQKPDIAHLHNIYHHLSPSIINTLKNNNIPIVMTVHDYYLYSPVYSLFLNGKVFDPEKNKYWQIIKHKAIKGSLLASILASMVHVLHYSLYKKIDCFICPSQFMADYIRKVYPKAKIKVINNFTEMKHESVAKDDYYLYVGRIIEEKGVGLILQAAKELPHYNFHIAGTGPDEKKYKKEYDLPNIIWLGYLKNGELKKEIAKAQASIVPSVWYENCSLGVLESLALNTPVIASDMGGNPELVINDYNGLIFKNNDIDSLITAIKKINSAQFNGNAIASSDKYSWEKFYQKLMNVYENVL
jgi:glycosyltransferase involved in cell wall biosynthesis